MTRPPSPLRPRRRRLRRFALWATGVAALLAAIVVAAGSCMSFTMKPERVDAFFASRRTRPTFHTDRVDGRPLHWVEVGDPARPTVFFVHGSPGTWDAFIGFLGDPELAARAHLVAVDRPGFGGSGRGRAEPSLVRQAAAILPALGADRAGLPAILVGHSLGGPIVAQLAVDDPATVAGLVLVAPSIDPDLETHRWYNVMASWRVVDWLLPTDLVTCNRELWPLKEELERLRPRWSEIRVPVTVIQGEDDDLVDPGNADFAARVLVHAPVEVERVPGLGHLIPWQRPELIKRAILAQLRRLEEEGGPRR
jgi:pimeloyl-ACP methyl ester carboxylesterase